MSPHVSPLLANSEDAAFLCVPRCNKSDGEVMPLRRILGDQARREQTLSHTEKRRQQLSGGSLIFFGEGV